MAFTTHHGLYRFVLIPSGLNNDPTTFQRATDFNLSLVNCKCGMVCLWGTIVFTCSPCNHIEHVKRVLSLLRDAAATINLNSCNVFTGTFDYLCHINQSRHLKTATHTTDTIKDSKLPKNSFELCLFFGLDEEFRCFVLISARIVAPLNQKLKKNPPTHFGTLSADELVATHKPQDKLVTPSILALPLLGIHYTLDTNVCNVRVGCVLLQNSPMVQLNRLNTNLTFLQQPSRLATLRNESVSW